MEPKISVPEISNLTNITRQAVHKKLREKEIKALKKGNVSYLTFNESESYFNFEFQNKVVSIHIVKGGVGKTTLTQSIAIRASLYGARVLIIDIDPQANITESFNVDPYKYPVLVDIINENKLFNESIINVIPGVDLVPSRIENISLDTMLVLKRIPLEKALSKYIDPIKDNYDLILFDCPPSIGESVTSAILASIILIAPVIPSKYATSALKILIEEIKNLKEGYSKKIDVKILLNNFDNRKNSSHKTLSKILENKQYKNLMFQSFIRTSQMFENVLDDQISIFDSTKWTIEKEDIDLITRELLNIEL